MSKSIKSQEMSGLISNCFRAIQNKDLQDLKSHMEKLTSCYAEDEEDEISIWDAMDSSGETMLTLSCRLHLLDIVHYLVLDIGFNVNTPNAHNLYPIHAVCMQEPKDNDIIKIIATGLSKLGITERTQQDRFGNTALHLIAQFDNDSLKIEAINILLQSGVSAEVGYIPPLVLCCEFTENHRTQHHLELIKLLASHSSAKVVQTAVDTAQKYRYAEPMSFLTSLLTPQLEGIEDRVLTQSSQLSSGYESARPEDIQQSLLGEGTE